LKDKGASGKVEKGEVLKKGDGKKEKGAKKEKKKEEEEQLLLKERPKKFLVDENTNFFDNLINDIEAKERKKKSEEAVERSLRMEEECKKYLSLPYI
jgi:hypothetical protein